MQDSTELAHDDYAFGWIAALPKEQAAARAMLDEMHQDLPQKEGDPNIYTLGSIGNHNIVIAGLPIDGYGTVNAATVAKDMHRTFPSLRDYLVVGAAGGAGIAGKVDVRLGDIVVSERLIQYDLKKDLLYDDFETTAIPLRPSQKLRMAVGKLKAGHMEEESEIPEFIRQIADKSPRMKAFASRESLQDLLFENTYEHSGPNDYCHGCSPSKLVKRAPREHNDPEIHYGVIASGNSLIKSPKRRNELVRRFNALCFEMEAAGMIESHQCLVIRSICDYADSHKNKQWQPYAAAAAAAYAKKLILAIPVSESQVSELERNYLQIKEQP
ncbi:purine and uridine phosphorylase [Xylaria sp. FL1777]|nr:purine and uridine phosphorylase [Xylaria sp. FL1777]